MPDEEWRTAPGWPGYLVSDRGKVRSVDRVLADGREAGGKLLKPRKDKDGYRRVTLVNGAERWDVHVGRLVLFAFAGWPPEPGMEACHKNGRRWDNRAANLYWGTKPQNRQDRERHRERRAARRAGRAGVTEVKEEKQGEIEETACCPSRVDSGVSSC